MESNPKEILANYQKNRISRENTLNNLITLIYKTDNLKERIESIHILDQLNFQDPRFFKLLENLLISDSQAMIRNLSIKIIQKKFIGDAFVPICWAFQHEKNMICLLNIIETLGKIKNDLSKAFLLEQLKKIEFLDFRLNLMELIRKKQGKPYLSNKNLANFLKNYLILKHLTEKFEKIKYNIKKGLISELDLSFVSNNIFNWNIMTEIPEFIGILEGLEKLDLKFNKLRRIPESIEDLKSLKFLDLSNNIINILPDSISELRSLEYLNLQHNDLKVINEDIGKLKNLKFLNLRHNKIFTLPDSFKELEELVFLDLHGNGFEYIPEVLKKLRNIVHLEIGLNKIKELSNALDIPKLKRLGLGGNKINFFSSRLLESLCKIEELDLYDNNIRELSNNFGYLVSIKKLSLHNNHLKSLPSTFKNLTSLETLDLSWNEFSEFPKQLKDLPSIKNIDLSGNKIKKIPGYIHNFSRLKELDLRFNKVMNLPGDVKELADKGVSILI